MRLGWLHADSRWRQCEANRHHSESLMAGLYAAENVFFLKGVYGMRFGAGIQSFPAIMCDDTFVACWETGRSGERRHCVTPGTIHLNVERLTEKSSPSQYHPVPDDGRPSVCNSKEIMNLAVHLRIQGQTSDERLQTRSR